MDSSSPDSEQPKGPKRAIYQAETTGSAWGDLKEAIKRINEIPCARNSLLSGIASGAGIGVIRGMSSGAFVASNWAVGTFVLISLGTWTLCQRSVMEERKKVQQVVESMPLRFAKKKDDQELVFKDSPESSA
ncbi:hypothetical protein NM688_g7801 [Phlebia brevispora]|uniref:Uncharacterized protein n=1 Tax=Phlebia brevispora TaxID=194682 RepID=A0ACC1S0Z9_9APHY|nr:hypothetical protein NM688_g7801 [Phlebia brevispora]